MIVLGSTGSIGKSTLWLARKYSLNIKALACRSDFALLNEQIREFKPDLVYIQRAEFSKNVEHKRVFSGDIVEFLRACASSCEASKTTLVNALVGFDGLVPSFWGQKLGFKLALANKESLVAGGAFLDTDKIVPIDSEHFGLKFLLANSASEPKALVITASGGAVADMSSDEIATLSAEKALKHPNWNMGAKITVDSATMANKLFEVLEAYHLYKIKDINAFIERTSSVHALVEFVDGSTSAHLSRADMKLAIAHALGLKERILEPISLLGLRLEFSKIDLEKYPVFGLKDEMLNNSKKGVIINSANDVMVGKFLNNLCSFSDISKNIFIAYEKFCNDDIKSFEDVLEMNIRVRGFLK